MNGDSDDFLRRFKAPGILPPWFRGLTPILDAVLAGPAIVFASIYARIKDAKAQTRIGTSTGAYLDLTARDFFGRRIKRVPREGDDAFRTRVLQEITRPRGTRPAMERLLVDLTGRPARIIEPQRPADTGAYGAPNSGYRRGGAYGSLLLPAQVFIEAKRPKGAGIPKCAGYGGSRGGYGRGAVQYASLSMIGGVVTDVDIHSAISACTPIGVTAWTNISD